MAIALRDTLAAQAPEEPRPVLAPMSPGSLIDRITIMRIKSAKLEDSAVLLEHARNELAAESAAIADLERQLEEVNRRLWDVEDELRACEARSDFGEAFIELDRRLWDVEDELRACEARSDFGDAFIDLARSVYRLNDQRAKLKRRIDCALGSTLTEVKKYAAYGVPSVPDQLEAIG